MKAIKWLFISVFGLVVVSVGSYFLFPGPFASWSSKGVGIDGGAGSWVMRSLFHDGPRYYELTTKLEVDGKPVEIKRVIECKPYFAHRPEKLFQKRWYTDQEAMTHRLPDGSGIIVVGPRFCEEFAAQQPDNAPSWKAFPSLPEDYVPLILWTAHAGNPEMLEGYHSFESVERPGSRIRFKSIALRNSSDLESSVYPEEFGIWVMAKFGGLSSNERPRQAFNYKGYYLLSLGREAWETVPELRAGLEAMTVSGFLKPELRHLVTGLSTNDIEYGAKGVIRTRRSNAPKPQWAESQNFSVDGLRELWGIDRAGEKLIPNPKYKGIVTYFPRERLNEPALTEWVRVKNYVVQLNEDEIVWPNNSDKYYYDVKSETIFRISFSPVTFYVSQREE